MGKRNSNSWEGQRPRCPQPQPETAQNAKNQAIRKNSTIPQSNFYSSWGLAPEDQPQKFYCFLSSIFTLKKVLVVEPLTFG